MKCLARIGLVLFVSVVALLFPGCYPHTCAPNDTTCLPCTDLRTTNPACVPDWEPIPVEAKKPDGGSR